MASYVFINSKNMRYINSENKTKNSMMVKETQITSILILPSPGMGHLIPLVEFAKNIHHHDFTVTIAVPNSGPPSKAETLVLDSLPPSISHFYLPPVDFTDVPDTSGVPRIFLTVTRSLPSLREMFKSLSSTNELPVVLVVDLFGADAFDVAKEFSIKPYLFFLSAAQLLSFSFYLPELDEKTSDEYKDLLEPVWIPGWRVPVRGADFPDPVQNRKTDAYKGIIHSVKQLRFADGILVNTFLELESEALKVLQTEPNNPPVYPVGPLVRRECGDRNDESECMTWLDDQPLGSVVFVSFGSDGTLTSKQTNELAIGLEMSGQNFLWVVRSPSDIGYSDSYLDSQGQKGPLNFLPTEFQDRTKHRGLLVSSWAPQADILSHASTGGFLTHCGWNSTLESLVNGIPLIAWPLYAEQKMNAVLLCEDMKVALRPTANEDGVIEKEEIARIIKSLMEGEEGKRVRKRMGNLKNAAAKGVSEDGSSTNCLSQVALNWKNINNTIN